MITEIIFQSVFLGMLQRKLLLPSYPSFATICGKMNFDDIIKKLRYLFHGMQG
jgi:hypothetical protein